jgi:carboxyl-terminal processing protease
MNRSDGVFGGIGVDVEPTDRGLEVLNCDPGTPAADADIRPGDIIERIDGQAVAGLSLVESEENLLNGPPGEEVALVIVRPEDPETGRREVVIRRAIIHREVVRGWSRDLRGRWRYLFDPAQDVAYVRLLKFTHDAPQQLDRAMDRLISDGVKGLILDLRDNTGGLLDSAREIADRFLDSGLIVRVAGRRTDEKQWSAMHEGTYPPIALAILINGASASASEIVAGALRDHGRAVIIGERSYGKGSVQEVVELGHDAGAIKLTTAYYFLPSGHCIHKTPEAARDRTWGVKPSVTVKMSEAQMAERRAAWRKAARTPIVPDRAATTEDADEPPVMDPIALDLCRSDAQMDAALTQLQSMIEGPSHRGADNHGATQTTAD